MVSATIDTGALRHNLNALRQHAPKSRAMAVIKANAYGHGLITAARALDTADAFGVARIDEGLALRGAGIKKTIVLLEGVLNREQLDAAAGADFELIVHAPEQIELLRAAPKGGRFKAWLKLDCGMNRLGFKGEAFQAAYSALKALPALKSPPNLITHLAAADRPDLPTTAEQLKTFADATRGLEGERSIASSAAIFLNPEAHADWVRPGVSLYGVSPFGGSIGAQHGLRPVMTLRSCVIGVKNVATGERVGYGGEFTAARPTRLAIAGVGYGDGYSRALASGTPLLVNGERAALAGRVSMDMIAIDVTDVKQPPKVGDPVVLWGEGLPAEEVATWAKTNAYSLLCGVSQRVTMREV
jgi:alanine racemase